jgi:L-alanine-DL-glutamate epimerase-like enolase superfamily enzyme
MPFAASQEVVELPFRDPFRIARAEPDRVATTVIVSLSHSDIDGIDALGEAFPVAYYGETPGTVAAVLPLLLAAVNRLGDPPGELERARVWLASAAEAMGDAIGHNGAAKCGLDIALHDWVARRLGIPLWQLLGASPVIPPTDFSIGIDTPDAVAERASKAAHFPALKIKVGGPTDLATLEQVRAVYTGPIRVDANTGWELDEGARLIPELVRLGVELIEQPFPAHQLSQLRWLQEHSEIPIVVDESAVTIDDLENLVGVVAGINVKLTKCGGVGPARRMLERARELGFKRMLGCMEETSVGVAAGAAIASLADWIDLDGNLLLADEPFEGLTLGDDCRWQLGTRPGLGVRRRGRDDAPEAVPSAVPDIELGDEPAEESEASGVDDKVA